MKKILLVVLVSVLLFSCSEKEIKRYHVDEIVSPQDSLIYLKKYMSLITGVVCDSSRGSIILEFNVKNGLKVGNYRQWYKGQLEKRLNFKKGYRDGLYQEWYENGDFVEVGSYKNDKKNGIWKIYNEPDHPFNKIEWEFDVVFYEDYYKDDEVFYRKLYLSYGTNKEVTLTWEGDIKDDKIHGVWKSYLDGDQLDQERNYKEGNLDGIQKWWWYDNGQLASESNYKDGYEDGLSKKWYDNGQLKSERNYKDGKEDGLSKKWYKNGQLYYERNYKEGNLDGIQKWWYDNGQLKSESNYKDGKEDGLSKKWYENGKRK